MQKCGHHTLISKLLQDIWDKGRLLFIWYGDNEKRQNNENEGEFSIALHAQISGDHGYSYDIEEKMKYLSPDLVCRIFKNLLCCIHLDLKSYSSLIGLKTFLLAADNSLTRKYFLSYIVEMLKGIQLKFLCDFAQRAIRVFYI